MCSLGSVSEYVSKSCLIDYQIRKVFGSIVSDPNFLKGI